MPNKLETEFNGLVTTIEKMAATKRQSGLSDEEDKTLHAAIARADVIKAELDDSAALDAVVAKYGRIAKDEPKNEKVETRSSGTQFVQSDAYRALMARGKSGTWTTGPIELDRVQMANELTEAASDIVQPQFLPGITAPFLGALGFEDVIAAGTTNSSSVRYVSETTTTNNADSVNELGTKVQSVLQFTANDEPVRKIAHSFVVSDEMLEDEAAMASYLDARLTLMTRMAVEDQLLNGTGTPPDISGLLDRAIGTTTTWSDVTVLDDIFTAAMAVEDNTGYPADFVCVAPADYPLIALAKDGVDRYYGSGPYGPINQGPWGLRLAKSSKLTAGTIIVGSGALGAQVFTRGGYVVEASNSDGSNFVKNQVTIRAEVRKALAVYNLAAFEDLEHS